MIKWAVGLEKNVTDREQTDRESNYRGQSNPQWIVRVSGPILISNNYWVFLFVTYGEFATHFDVFDMFMKCF